jgi:hypothetical protein
LVAHLLARGHTDGIVQDLTRPLLLDAEITVPTWFSSSLLLLIAAACALAAWRGGELARRWWVLSVVFVFLSLDEAVIIHELGDELMARVLDRDVDVPLWTIPAGIAVLVVGAYCLRLYRSQPSHLRRAWVVALLAFVGGAVGFEALGRPHYAVPSEAGVTYILLSTIEEGLEMAGALIFLWAVMWAAHEPVRAEAGA